jgi:hypothetical protein
VVAHDRDPDAPLEVLPNVHQDRVVGERAEQQMEAEVCFDPFGEVGAAVQPGQRRAQGGQRLLSPRGSDDLSHGQPSEGGPHLVEASYLLRGQLVHPQHAAMPGVDESFLLEVAQRLADRPPADPQARRQLDLSEMVPPARTART